MNLIENLKVLPYKDQDDNDNNNNNMQSQITYFNYSSHKNRKKSTNMPCLLVIEMIKNSCMCNKK